MLVRGRDRPGETGYKGAGQRDLGRRDLWGGMDCSMHNHQSSPNFFKSSHTENLFANEGVMTLIIAL